MRYEVWLAPRAKRQMDRLPASAYDRIRQAVDGLTSDPRPHGCTKLAGRQNEWRIRVGDYRAVYVIDDTARLVRVQLVAHRRAVYDRPPSD